MQTTPSSGSAKPWPDLRTVIRERLIDLAFQPIVRSTTGDALAFEALTRPHPESQFPNPGVLFAAAEAFHLSWDLEAVVRERIADAAKRLPAGRLLFFNSSPGVFADERYPRAIEEFVERSGLPRDRFVLEITERAEGDGSGALEANALKLRDAGFQIAIDDMGAGSSGLNRIMALRPTWLKLDREIVRGIDNDPYRQNIVRFLGYFTRLGGARLIAEGVETFEELNTIVDLGADCVQGFAIARPGPLDQTLDPSVAAWMRERGSMVDREWESVGRLRSIEPIAAPLSACKSLPRHGEPAIDISASIADALRAMAERADVEALTPLPATGIDGERLAVRAGDLLRAAARQLGEETLHFSPIFEMPDSFACELAVQRRIAAGDESSLAVIDVRRMGAYNAAVGNELGDLLLSHLAGLLRTAARRNNAFVGHMGDDRFLLIATQDALAAAVEEIVLRFDRASMRYASSPAPGEESGSSWLDAPSLRAVVIPRAFIVMTEARSLWRLIADERDAAANPAGSSVSVLSEAAVARRLARPDAQQGLRAA